MDLADLRKERKAIADIARLHGESVLWFRHPNRPWFRITAAEAPKERELRHLSSSATCLESLAGEIRTLPADLDRHVTETIQMFAMAALDAPAARWESEGAARVYCRVRTLPVILQHTPQEALVPFADAIREHMEFVWRGVSLSPGWQGVAEAPDPRPGVPTARQAGPESVGPEADQAPADEDGEPVGYPPHSFHTYWAIVCLNEIQRRQLFTIPKEMARNRQLAELWTERTLAAETALASAGSDRADANQLAWALATQFLSPIDPQTSESARLDLYRAGLKAFFSQQLPSGGWGLYQPLFHFPRAGNAYCYTFETLTHLLRPALHRDRGKVYRELFEPYLGDLVKAWHLARDTALPLEQNLVGWCSGHHPFRKSAEAWATAEVLAYLQCLRRLLGIRSGEAASEVLGVGRPRWPTPQGARGVLEERGQTWAARGQWTVAMRLSALFLHPLDSRPQESDELDPDLPLIQASQARSAILFGPPGTSKTTVVEALAGALGWRFVEIHASDFLTGGMAVVSARADELFASLMELDHCVVLFDEIDELLRERQGESDPFGRFLTTSMLPKVAKLWEQRRVLYFLATNDAKVVDRAIRRSERFDASIFAAPPGFHPKLALLKTKLALDSVPGISWNAVSESLRGRFENDPLGIFAILRHDQIAELAERIQAEAGGGSITMSAVTRALDAVGKDLRDNEWAERDPYDYFREYRALERRDRRAVQLVRAEPMPEQFPPGLVPFAESPTGQPGYLIVENEALAFQPETGSRGNLSFEAGTLTMVDAGLLVFVPATPQSQTNH